jgi:hypothetical protein
LPPGRFEPTISADEQSNTHALDRAATGTGNNHYAKIYNKQIIFGTSEQIRLLCFVENGHIRTAEKRLKKYAMMILGEMCV